MSRKLHMPICPEIPEAIRAERAEMHLTLALDAMTHMYCVMGPTAAEHMECEGCRWEVDEVLETIRRQLKMHKRPIPYAKAKQRKRPPETPSK